MSAVRLMYKLLIVTNNTNFSLFSIGVEDNINPHIHVQQYQEIYEKARCFAFIRFYSCDIIACIITAVLTYSTLRLCIIEMAYSAAAR